MFHRSYRYDAIVTVFLILPLLSATTITRQRRRPSLEQQLKSDLSPFPDQIAEASQFEPNHLVSASYSTNKEPVPGNVRHGKIVVKLEEPANIDALSDVTTAEEYVHKALQLRIGVKPPIPQRESPIEISHPNIVETKSKFSDYQVYEPQQTAQTAIPYSEYEKELVSPSHYSAYDYTEASSTEAQNLYQGYSTEVYGHLKQSSQIPNKISEYQEQYPPADNSDYYEHNTKHPAITAAEHSQTAEKSDYYGPGHQLVDKSSTHYEYLRRPAVKSRPEQYQHHIPKHNFLSGDELGPPGGPSKEEILRQIEESVNKYMKTLENNKITRAVQEAQHGPNRSKIHEIYSHQQQTPTVDTVHDIVDNPNDNIHFIYKTRPRSPPIPQKIPINFDHNGALKNLQNFDLSHVAPGDRPIKIQPSFNKDKYFEINELRPIHFENKPPKNVHINRENQAFKKNHQDIRPSVTKQYESIGEKQNSAESSWQPINPANLHSEIDGSYDSYNPKFNHNPEGYGYQVNYKQAEGRGNQSSKRHVKPTKRGKRGGNGPPGRNNFNVNKDVEASIALRPPPF